MPFHLSIFHFGQIKGKPWENDEQLVRPFALTGKTKCTFK